MSAINRNNNLPANLQKLIDDRISLLKFDFQTRYTINDISLSVGNSDIIVLSIRWQQSKVADIPIHLCICGAVSQNCVLTSKFVLDGQLLNNVYQQTLLQGYYTDRIPSIIPASPAGSHKLDYVMSVDAGTYTIDAFDGLMYIESNAFVGSAAKTPKITIAEHWTNISIEFNPVINLKAMTESLTPTLNVWTPVPISINEHWSNISIEFTPPVINLRAMTENVTLKIT